MLAMSTFVSPQIFLVSLLAGRDIVADANRVLVRNGERESLGEFTHGPQATLCRRRTVF